MRARRCHREALIPLAVTHHPPADHGKHAPHFPPAAVPHPHHAHVHHVHAHHAAADPHAPAAAHARGPSAGGAASPRGAAAAPGGAARKARAAPTPWRRMLRSPAVWAIVINNFAFHYAFYVIMNWMPTYFNAILKKELSDLGPLKTLPYLAMFLTSNAGGWAGDWLIVRRGAPVAAARKAVNTAGAGRGWAGREGGAAAPTPCGAPSAGEPARRNWPSASCPTLTCIHPGAGRARALNLEH